jgi:hypothetical protein
VYNFVKDYVYFLKEGELSPSMITAMNGGIQIADDVAADAFKIRIKNTLDGITEVEELDDQALVDVLEEAELEKDEAFSRGEKRRAKNEIKEETNRLKGTFTNKQGRTINAFALMPDGTPMTKEQWDEVGYDAIAEELKQGGGLFDGLIVKGIQIDSKNPNVHGVPLGQFIEDVKLGTDKQSGLLGILKRFRTQEQNEKQLKTRTYLVKLQISLKKKTL